MSFDLYFYRIVLVIGLGIDEGVGVRVRGFR